MDLKKINIWLYEKINILYKLYYIPILIKKLFIRSLIRLF